MGKRDRDAEVIPKQDEGTISWNARWVCSDLPPPSPFPTPRRRIPSFLLVNRSHEPNLGPEKQHTPITGPYLSVCLKHVKDMYGEWISELLELV